ncbi:Possible Trypsin [uncultured Gammaproteobacteria bacterium]|uniref:2OG-Fe(II) oxygenase n=1 Tax=Bathymodiolus heckerae thiotrophic gill symbiont TaxID=1052212 RepID=UPI0010AF7E96|nr:2OG-Fe(II) oxygenase [Bathymodiolus heckerae thiotrophic gill symbiont]CAC9537404.1 Possible Trypsin [uncultured Gammaproteobacteria bacterium]CAC9952852.1 Possible Trypsin [uncultured Gammaproteobacteria bacterium]CAC9965494.1 Possible Trypsin [uncultured Gammaproteobacteria bacterium]SHN90233.1 Possible Trypsin [Bathymodiolus heckerae thiotrophic gill symbiont]
MQLIGRYQNSGYEAVADGVMEFFKKRKDLQRPGIAFGSNSSKTEPAKVSTDISLVALSRSDPESFALSDLIVRGVSAALERYLQERPLFREVCPEQELFVMPIFNLQHYAPGEGFHQWHCDWTINDEVTEPGNRVLAWILYCDSVEAAGTEFHWQKYHEKAERGKLVIFPASPSHIHRGQVNNKNSKTIATGWINAGSRKDFLKRLAHS